MSVSLDNLTIDRAVKELYRAFHLLNDKLYGGSLNEPAILIQHQGTRTKNVYGWCTINKIWRTEDKRISKYEINITAEYLNRDITEVIQTLIHEMVHLYCSENDIKETSRNGNYHNKKFKDYAERVGLNVEKSKSSGFNITSLRPETKIMIEQLNLDREAFIMKRYTWEDEEADPEKEKEPTKRRKKDVWTCPTCKKPNIKSNDELNIICGKCMSKFICIKDDEDEDEDVA